MLVKKKKRSPMQKFMHRVLRNWLLQMHFWRHRRIERKLGALRNSKKEVDVYACLVGYSTHPKNRTH